MEIILNNPALGDLQMPAFFCLVADGDYDARWFARLQDDDDLVRLGALEVRLEFVAATFRRIQDQDVALR